MPKQGKGMRCKYASNDMAKAVAQVQLGNLSIRKAAETFNVPRSSLHDHISGRMEVHATPGKRTVFPAEVEHLLQTC
ncbi:hypothetical protein DPMN_023424 [Dreissena polymorpha]|uniref:HTH psq-type domain-containing protein n=1 Tax=Dreissena polymorpha TaxID=45954 RepID=A0A9D4LMW6_DREPO|nr:hypothetical protein DPMN_023424 [Dreissena polymorpha]